MKLKIFLFLLGIALIAGVSIKVYQEFEVLLKKNSTLIEELSKANLSIGQAEVEKKSLAAEIKNLDEQVQKSIEERNGLVTEIGKFKTIVQTHGQIITKTETIVQFKDREIPTQYIPDPMPMVLDFEDYRLKTSIQFTLVMFSKGVKLVTPAMRYAFTQEINGVLVRTVDASGGINFYLKLKGRVSETEYENIPLASFEVMTEDVSKKHFTWFNPHLDLGGMVGFNLDKQFESGITTGISFMSYGLTKNDLSWRFIRLGLHLDRESVGLDIAPVLWNVGDILPLISNMWIGPMYGIDLNKKSSLGLLLAVDL